MFDWGSGVCFWSNSNETREKFCDYPIEELEKLPISDELVRELYYLISKHDEALNRDDPGGELFWNEQDDARFKQRATAAY